MKTLGTHYVTIKTDTRTVFFLIVQGPHSETHLSGILILDFPVTRTVRYKFCCISHQSMYFIMAAWADKGELL